MDPVNGAPPGSGAGGIGAVDALRQRIDSDSRNRWLTEDEIREKRCRDGAPVSTLTGKVDQAALHGLLRRLYSLGLPLISVIYMLLVRGGTRLFGADFVEVLTGLPLSSAITVSEPSNV